jgi:hypothetical protein
MHGSHITRHLALAVGLTITLVGSGCDLLESLDGDGTTVVQLFTTHHATPEDGEMPNRGEAGEYRIFETDEGWSVTLMSGYITTSGVTLHSCDGETEAVDLFWGDLAEDLNESDLDLSSLGSVEVGPTEFCQATVHYSPFVESAPEIMPRYAEVQGATVFLTGLATKDDQRVEFEIRATGSVDVNLDLRPNNGGRPLRITGDENFPIEITLSKTYDRFFDGIDFSGMQDLDMNEQALAVLEFETRVDPGTVVSP